MPKQFVEAVMYSLYICVIILLEDFFFISCFPLCTAYVSDYFNLHLSYAENKKEVSLSQALIIT
jgi:hypothetical protein